MNHSTFKIFNGSIYSRLYGVLAILLLLSSSAFGQISNYSCGDYVPVTSNNFSGASVTGGITPICLLCSTSNAPNVINSNPASYGTMNLAVGVGGGGFFEVSLGATMSAGTDVGWALNTEAGALGGVLGLNLLNGITVSTYLGTTLQDSYSGGNLLGLELLGLVNNRSYVGFKSTKRFDKVRIHISAVLSVLSTPVVYNAFVRQGCADFESCPSGSIITSGTFVAGGGATQSGVISIPIKDVVEGGVSVTASGGGFSSNPTNLDGTLTPANTLMNLPVIYNGTGTAGMHNVSVTLSSLYQTKTCIVSVRVGPPSPPVISSIPVKPINGESAVLTAVGCPADGQVKWLRNGNQVSVGTSYTVTVPTGSTFTALCTVDNVNSAVSNSLVSGERPGVPTTSASPNPIISGESATLTASGCAGSIKWYNGNAVVSSANPFTVSSVPAGASYTATCTVSAVESNKSTPALVSVARPGAVTITSNPSTPIVGEAVALSASACAGTVRWFNGTSVIGNGTPLNINLVPSGAVYSARCIVSGIESNLSNTLTATLRPSSPGIASSPQPPVDGEAVTLTATNCTGTVEWFNHGVYIGNGALLNIATVSPSSTFTARCTVNNIASLPSGAIVSVPKTGVPVIAANPNPPIVGESVSLSASSCTGTIIWYNGNTNIGSGVTLSIPSVVSNSSFTATCTVNGVESDKSASIVARVRPVAPTINSAPIVPIEGESATLTSSGCSGTVTWQNNGNTIGTGVSITVSPVSVYSSFSAFCTVNGVSGASATPIVSGSRPAAPAISANPYPAIVGESVVLTSFGCSGTVNWLNNGVGFGTGTTISVNSISNNSVFTATCTLNGVTSNPSPNIATFTRPSSPVVSISPNPLIAGEGATMSAGNCAGTVIWYNNGVSVFTGAIYSLTSVPANSNYTAVCVVSGVSSNHSEPTSALNRPDKPLIYSLPNPPLNGEPATLISTNCSGAVIWYNNGSMVWSGALVSVPVVSPNSIYTAICTANGVSSLLSDPIQSIARPSAPSITSSQNPPVVGSATELTASDCAGTVSWFNNGVAIGSGTSLNISAVTSYSTYTAICAVDGVNSNPSNPIMSINRPEPPVISSNPQPPVIGSSLTLNASGCVGGTVTWYNNGVSIGTGTSIVVNPVVAGSGFTATCSISGVEGEPSNPIVANGTARLAVALTTNSGALFVNGMTKSFVFTVKNIGVVASTPSELIISDFAPGFSFVGLGSHTVNVLQPQETVTFTVSVTATNPGASGSFSASVGTSAVAMVITSSIN